MALVTYHPFRSLQQEINRVFDDLFGDIRPGIGHSWYPSVDVLETQTAFVIKAELPGVTSKDVKLNMTNNTLTLYGEKKQESEEESHNYYRVERIYGTFERSFTFPSDVEADKISATYKDGVLVVTVPKAERVKPKEIPITTS